MNKKSDFHKLLCFLCLCTNDEGDQRVCPNAEQIADAYIQQPNNENGARPDRLHTAEGRDLYSLEHLLLEREEREVGTWQPADRVYHLYGKRRLGELFTSSRRSMRENEI